MVVLYENEAFSILVLSTKKTVLQTFEKGFYFPENLFQSWNWSIENVQNFHWLSHKSMPISQMEGYFENP